MQDSCSLYPLNTMPCHETASECGNQPLKHQESQQYHLAPECAWSFPVNSVLRLSCCSLNAKPSQGPTTIERPSSVCLQPCTYESIKSSEAQLALFKKPTLKSGMIVAICHLLGPGMIQSLPLLQLPMYSRVIQTKR